MRRIKSVRFGSDGAIGRAIPDCPNCPSAPRCAGRPRRSANRRDGLRRCRRHRYDRSIRRGGAAGDRGDDALLGNNIDDDIRNERRDIGFVGHLGEIHGGGDRRRAGGGVIRSRLQCCTALGDVPAIRDFGDGTVPRRHQSFLRALIEARDQPRGPGTVGVISLAELRAQQPFFGVDAREKRRDQQRAKQHADSGTKRQSPAQRIDQQP
jgi:hypothetical protein